MLKKIGCEEVRVSSDPALIGQASRLILPGVGAFDHGMAKLAERELIEPLNRAVLDRKVPILGICLGMQLMMERSEEGIRPGLGWFKGHSTRFEVREPELKVPHMGWNWVSFARPHALSQGLGTDSRFYFVHSYHVVPVEATDVLATSKFGTAFVSAISRENLHGVQFHPEKSHRYGMNLMRNFVEAE